jgi:hypothetical protein
VDALVVALGSMVAFVRDIVRGFGRRSLVRLDLSRSHFLSSAAAGVHDRPT